MKINFDIKLNTSFNAIYLTKDEKLTAIRLFRKYNAPISEKESKQLKLDIFEIFNPHLKKLAEQKTKQFVNKEDFLQNIYLKFFEFLEIFKSAKNPIYKLCHELDKIHPTKLDVVSSFDTVSLDKNIFAETRKPITIKDILSNDDRLKPLGQLSDEQIQEKKKILQNVVNSIEISEKNKKILIKKGSGEKIKDIAKNLGISIVTVNNIVRTGIAKLQDKNGALPQNIENQAKRMILLLGIEKNLDEVKQLILDNIFLENIDLYNVSAKIEKLVKNFKKEGLTPKDYVNAAISNPRLFTQSPNAIEHNVRKVAEIFKDDGLTVKNYLQICLKQPSLFSLRPETIERNIKLSVQKFKNYGLTTKDFISLGLKNPGIFARKPETLEYKIKRVAEMFEKDGMTSEKYFKACLKQRALFTYNPDTVIGNINNTVKTFSKYGLTTKDYIKAGLKQPVIFCMSADKIETNLNKFLMYFKKYNLTKEMLLKAFLKQPAICYLLPETMSKNMAQIMKKLEKNGIPANSYFNACLKHPSLFTQLADTIEKNTDDVIKNFKKYGLTEKDYLKACISNPQLFSMSPSTIKDNFYSVIKRFEKENLCEQDWLKACLRYSQLFYQKPETIENNIRSVVKNFAKQGLSTKNYLILCLKRPSLISMNPDTVSSHIRAFLYSNFIRTKDASISTINIDIANSIENIYITKIILPALKKIYPKFKNSIYNKKLKNEIVEFFIKNPDKFCVVEIKKNGAMQNFINTMNDFSNKNIGRNIFRYKLLQS